MKNQTLIITCLAAAAITAGCDRQPTAAQQLDQVKTETKAAAEDMQDYTFAQKAEFVKQMQGELDKLNQDLDALSAKLANSSAAVKAEAKPKFQALRDQIAQLNAQLADTRNATETTWDKVKAESKKAYAATASGVLSARQWVSDQIAP